MNAFTLARQWPRRRSAVALCRLGALRTRADQPALVALQGTGALHARRPDREGERDDDADRAHAPSGFPIDSFVPAPGWKREVQQTGSGEEAVIPKVTWTGGSMPTGEDSVFQFLASPTSSKTYTFAVRQTYSDGSVVDWSGPESSDTPRRRSRRRARSAGQQLHARDHRARPRRASRSSSARHRAASRAGRPRARVRHRGGRRRSSAALRRRSRAGRRWAHAVLVQDGALGERSVNTPPTQVALTYSEAVEPRFAIVSVTDAPGARRRRGRRRARRPNPDTLVVPLKQLREGWYLVYWRVDLGRRPSGAGRVHLRRRPEPGPAPQFVIPSISETAATPGLLIAALGRLPLGDDGDRPASRCDAIARPLAGASPEPLRCVTVAFVVSRGRRARRDACVPARGDGEVRTSLRSSTRRARAAHSGVRIRPRLSSTSRSASRLRCRRRASRSGVDRPERATAPVGGAAGARRRAARGGAALLVPGPRRACGADLAARCSLRSTGCTSSSGSVWIGGLVGLLVIWRRCRGPPASPGLGRLRAALLERGVRLGDGAHRPGVAARHPPADPLLAVADLVRQGDPRQDRAARRGNAARRGQPAATRPPLAARKRDRAREAAARRSGACS